MSVFRKIGRAKTVHSRHDLSYEVKTDAHFGKLYPVFLMHCLPSDVVRIANEVVIRFNPMVAPLLHEINVFVHYFYVPYRILWDGWEAFITGGEDGMDNSVQPLWQPKSGTNGWLSESELINYMALGTGQVTVDHVKLLCYPQRAYNFIWNEYYRDSQIQDEVDLNNNDLLYRSWMKDYFTSARLDTQLGEAPAIPVVGDLDVIQDIAQYVGIKEVLSGNVRSEAIAGARSPDGGDNFFVSPVGSGTGMQSGDRLSVEQIPNLTLRQWMKDYVKVQGTSVDINQLREIVAIQRWKERNARAGARYKEFIMARFRNYPRDDRLQRPEYIGGTRSPVIVSEVLQQAQGNEIQSGTETPIGSMYGHGISVDRSFVSKYRSYEYGLIMGLMSVMPKPSYMNPLEREWTYETRYDYFTPEFQTLGEQPIFLKELVANAANANEIFGYQGRYNELRYKPNKVVGLMREDFAHWHMARNFDPGTLYAPKLNSEFLECRPDWERVFSVPSEPPMLVNFGNIVSAVRPMVAVPNPGLLDHF